MPHIPGRVLRAIITALIFSTLLSAMPLSLHKRLSSAVQKAAEPVLIDSAGVYIRASPLQVPNGTSGIIAGYAARDGNQKVLRVARSINGAKSWSRLGEVWRADSATHDIDNAIPLQLPSGRILYAFRNHDRTPSGRYTHYRITVCFSDDGGHTWRFLSQVAERDATSVNNGLWEPFLRLARDGTLQVYYSSENSAADQDNLMKYSRDGGASWSGPVMVSGGNTTSSRDGMTGVASLDNNGNLICVFENTESGPFSVDRVMSHDDGYTWGERARVYTAANGKNAGAPQVYNVGGTIVTSFMTNEAVNVAQLDGAQMKVVTSVDGGRRWSSDGGDATVTAETGSHWPGLYTLSSTTFLALYSKDGLGAVSQMYSLV
ncbi:glycoside hydrolase family 93 protein [Cercophora scortea]|uniref:Glycoside hydrolase family 93 protein n=1 Tax=Cercophora scortea TaxID=314031 RepID=A0AAE0I233_9PEZI|nr:glycoside hydrolase family 93 protein [Cercophora scortea]